MKRAQADELAQHSRYTEVCEQIALLREEKKQIENEVRAPADMQELDALKSDIASDKVLLTDLTLTTFLANESVEIVDDYNNKLVPAFTVRFKKN